MRNFEDFTLSGLSFAPFGNTKIPFEKIKKKNLNLLSKFQSNRNQFTFDNEFILNRSFINIYTKKSQNDTNSSTQRYEPKLALNNKRFIHNCHFILAPQKRKNIS